MNNKGYKNIIFDLDGTLTDSAEGVTRAAQYALKQLGIETNLDQLKPFIGPPLQHSFQKYYGFNEEEIKHVITYFRQYYQEKGLYENKLYPYVPEMLAKLSQGGKKLYLATSKLTGFAETILQHFQIDHYFTSIAGANHDGSRAKKRDVLKYLLAHNNSLDKGQTVMVGDHKDDISGAHDCSIDSIAVTYGYGLLEELQKEGPTGLAHSVSELAGILLGSKTTDLHNPSNQ